ncbi:MAG: bifunctional diguanylate cyclase/phosphodiesterase, partial [Oleibacter sp.]|nr:bifunctional diguanylate cyclase/phosphodiesterase [Thalassolituus sp.]
ISERDLQVQETLPKARELRSVVLAMNHMVRKLRAIFDEQARMTERLRQESYHDEATGLLNRRGFDQRLEHLLMGSDEHSGVLMILQVQKFADYNLRVGRLAGDELLKTLGKTLDQRCSELPQSFVGRRSGADIGLFFPCTDPAQADEFMQQLSSLLRMSVLPLREGMEFHVGGVFLQGKKDDPVLALSQADVALRQAQRQPKGCCVLYQSDDIQRIEWSAGDWRNVLKETLSKGAIELQFLPVINNVNTVTQLEVFSRLQWHDQTLSAARFWPMVEHHRLSSQFDLAIVNKVFTHLNNLTSVPKNVRVCINISPASIIDEDFQHQLIDLLQMYPRYTSLISLEIPEFALANVEVALTKLAPRLKLLGVELGIDQVGTGSMAFAYLQRLPLSYIRVDGSFNRGVHLSQDHRFFVQSMVQIAHNLDLQVMAEGLEQEEDVITVRATGIDGVGGYYFSQPMPALQDVLDWTKKG